MLACSQAIAPTGEGAAVVPTDPPLILFVGNSLTWGAGIQPGVTEGPANPGNYVNQAAALLPSGVRIQNLGVNGRTTPQMAADAAIVDSQYSDRNTANIVVAWEIGNDIQLGATATDAYSHFADYCAARKAAGWAVVALTVPPRHSPAMPLGFNDAVAYDDTEIRANWGAWADGLADVAADPRLLDPANGTYFEDGIHLTAAGYGVVASIVAPVVAKLLPKR